ncbi:unnamed protein product [Adineta steineri]|uniref:Uncharacterized protein n=1 Tax=Adineta steineri TaxID=433720 RepID=A0A814CYR1_9BILA|nr:unnamed protein product [Adineta steineri]
MYGNDCHAPRDNSSSTTPYRSTIITSASLSAISHHQNPPTSSDYLPLTSSVSSTNFTETDLSSKRPIVDNNYTTITDQLDDEDLIDDLNDTTETTRL